MKSVRFLKTKPYAGMMQKAGSVIPMRDDHAELLQRLGVAVIEDSPVVKLPIPKRAEPTAQKTTERKVGQRRRAAEPKNQEGESHEPESQT